MDELTRTVARLFVQRVSERFPVSDALLFGSRARGDFRPDSDVDIAVLLQGSSQSRTEAALRMADIAFDVMLETGILVEPIPFWHEEWTHPERFSNPQLIANIRQEGVRF